MELASYHVSLGLATIAGFSLKLDRVENHSEGAKNGTKFPLM